MLKIFDKRKVLVKDYKRVFGSEAGRRVYEDLMRECHMDSPAHHVDNVNETFVFGGMRAVGLYIQRTVGEDLSKKPELVEDASEPIET